MPLARRSSHPSSLTVEASLSLVWFIPLSLCERRTIASHKDKMEKPSLFVVQFKSAICPQRPNGRKFRPEFSYTSFAQINSKLSQGLGNNRTSAFSFSRFIAGCVEIVQEGRNEPIDDHKVSETVIGSAPPPPSFLLRSDFPAESLGRIRAQAQVEDAPSLVKDHSGSVTNNAISRRVSVLSIGQKKKHDALIVKPGFAVPVKDRLSRPWFDLLSCSSAPQNS